VEVLGFDPTLASPGKTVVKVVMYSNYDFWKKLEPNKKEYDLEKKKVADIIAEKLAKRFPGFQDKVEAVDVVTPVSVEHWTGAFRGGQAWGAPKAIIKDVTKNGVSKTLPGLQGFYMVGQWAGGTIGLNTVCLMGRNLVRDLCKIDKKNFETKVST
jgi:phytoene dehydrogenase-like protein